MTDKVTSLMRDALDKAKDATKSETHVIIVYESLRDSILADTYSFGCLAICILIGVIVGSTALQWIAGLMAIIFILHTAGRVKEKGRYTIQEAREKLNKIERGEG